MGPNEKETVDPILHLEIYKDIFYRANAGLAIIDKSGRFKDINESACKILQYTKEELLQKSFVDITHSDDITKSIERYNQCRKDLKSYIIEKKYIEKKGNVIYGRTTVIPVANEKGSFQYAIAQLQNITKLKITEKEVERSHSIINHISDPVVVTDTEGIIKLWNRGAEMLYKYTSEEVIGKPVSIIYKDEDLPILGKIINRLLSGEDIPQTQLNVIDKDRNELTILLALTSLKDSKGNITELVGFTKNFTKESKLLNKLKQAEETFDHAMNATKDGLFDWDLATNEIYYTPNWKKMLGYEDHELPNDFSVWEKLTHPDDVKKSWELLNEHIEGKRDRFEIEFQMKHKNGHWVDILSRAQALFNEEDKAIRVIGTHVDISEMKRVQKQLNHEKQLSQQYLDIAGVMMIALNSDQEVTLINPKGCEILGSSHDEIIGKNWFDHFIPSENLEEIKNVFNQIITGEVEPVKYYENPIKRKDGSLRIIAWHNSVLHDENGNISGLFSSGEDITDNLRIRNALAESEEKYRLLFSNMINGLALHEIVTDDKGKPIDYIFKDINKTFESITGLKRRDIIGRKVTEVIPGIEKDPANWIERYGEVAIKGESTRFEDYSEALGKHFSIIAFQPRSMQFATIFEDITEKRIAQMALAESEVKHRALYVNAPIAFQSLNEDGNIVDINPAWLRAMKYKREEVIGKWFGNFLHPDYVDHFRKNFPAFKKRGYVKDVRFQMMPKDKSELNVSYEGCVGYTPEGDFQQTYCTFVDITKQAKHEADLKQAKDKAEESDRLKSAFLANMSHEIRTPMNGILGFAELLKEPNLLRDEKDRYISIIEKSGERMLHLIGELIDISKIESGQMEVVYSNTNISDLMEYYNQFFQSKAVSNKIDLIYHPPKVNFPVVAFTDPEKLSVVIANLLSNAVKYTHEGRIEFGLEIIGGSLEFFVRDTGIGIPKNKLKNIFERFVQAESSLSSPYEGAGLGLAISKAYIELLHGEISVESEVGKGSHFRFTIPHDSKYLQKPRLVKEEVKTHKANLSDLKVLIVEDEESSDVYLTEILKKDVKEILHVTNGKDAINVMKDRPDVKLVLMDIKMPLMDGHTATKEIRKFNKDVIILAQTAYALEGDREMALKAGCNDYLSKPVKRAELFELMEKYI